MNLYPYMYRFLFIHVLYMSWVNLFTESEVKSLGYMFRSKSFQLLTCIIDIMLMMLMCLFMMVFGWLVVFNVPSTARSIRDGTPIYCPLRRT